MTVVCTTPKALDKRERCTTALWRFYVSPDVRILKLQELGMLPKAEQSVICCFIPVACYGLHPICSQHSLTSSLLSELPEFPAMSSYVARPV
jgi:hypothetical protein